MKQLRADPALQSSFNDAKWQALRELHGQYEVRDIALLLRSPFLEPVLPHFPKPSQLNVDWTHPCDAT